MIREWDNERDHDHLEYYGYECYLGRQPTLKYWTGYVIIEDKTHPWFGDDPRMMFKDIVHGGIVYADFSPFSDRDDAWWIGFHCGHPQLKDLIPYFWEEQGHNFPRLFKGEVYRNLDFAKEQAKLLAQQADVVKRWSIPESTAVESN